MERVTCYVERALCRPPLRSGSVERSNVESSLVDRRTWNVLRVTWNEPCVALRYARAPLKVATWKVAVWIGEAWIVLLVTCNDRSVALRCARAPGVALRYARAPGVALRCARALLKVATWKVDT